MKIPIITLAFVFSLFASCSKADKKTTVQEKQIVKTDLRKVDVEINEKKNIEIREDIKALVPVDLLDVKSPSGYDKYGIEFSGNCYSCDLANLSIIKDKIIWTNVCDENDTFEIENFTLSIELNKSVIKTAERTLTLTKIDKSPVYEMVVEGKELNLKNKRISRYFTTKQALPLFKEHDCGDFDG